MCRVGAAKGFAEKLVGGPRLFAGTRGGSSSSCYKMCRRSGRMSLGAPTDGRSEVGAGMVCCLLA